MDVANMVITVLGGLALFLFGMKVMSDGLQKVAGPKMRTILAKMTGNRFTGVFTGFGVTCAVQSSSATTVMLVSFVSAGLITLTESVGVVMGANIGTTFTGWLVALLGFKFKIIILAFPAIVIGFLPKLVGARKLEDWGEVLLGFGILFLGLDFMKDSVGQLKDSAAIIEFMKHANSATVLYRLAAVFIGASVTMVVQSSSATMAITLTLTAQGIIDVPTACALVLGENIGTTVTANLAAISANAVAKKTARAHFIFNIFGALWGVILFTPFLALVDKMVPGDITAGTGLLSKAVIASHVAMFHTMFNVINTAIFLPFVNQLAWVASKLVWAKDKTEAAALQYLNPHLMDSPPMALHATRQEVGRMVNEVASMMNKVKLLIESPSEKMGKTAEAISESEAIVDYLEKEITEYLAVITQGETSEEQSHEIAGFITAVSDIERMGDHAEALHKLLAKRYDNKIELTDGAKKELMEIAEKVIEFIALIQANLKNPNPTVMVTAKHLENSINDMRKQMRQGHVERLNNGECAVTSGLLFIDMLTSFEKMGDHAYNVAQVLAGER
ncbi:MAG: Na/Pi cotransporter family protein [Deltaproteobacteria bacterium]|nr:Na/Pi cotransporter family protein [Deltaproteobacteria bacterium]MBN2670118.1 Na/Pi cotransporter family protein [Deltaproteobacteria bacterium]